MMKSRMIQTVLLAGASLLGGCEACESHGHPHGDEDHGHAHGSDAESAGHDDHDGHDGGHEHAEDAIGITRWTDKLELFAEHPPAVAGEELPFLAHLTILDGFQALENATVTLVLEGSTLTHAQVETKLRSGIFQPKLKAPRAGTYKCRLEVTGPQIEDVIEGFEIVVHPNAQAAKKASDGDDTGGAEPISFLKEQQWKIPFATAFSVNGAVAPTVEVAGEVSTPPAGQAEVGAAISGRLVAPPKGIPKPGQVVKKGELLATIAPAPAAPEDGARAELAVVEAKARREAAGAAFERAKRLIADQAISQREVEDAKRELGVAEEAVKASERARAIFAGSASGSGPGSYRVTSPIDGIVVDVEGTTGQSLRGGDLLFRVVNLEEIWLWGKVPEQQAARIVAGQDAAFKLQGLEEWLPLRITGEGTNASVVNVGKVVDKRSRTVEIIYGLNEPDERLRIGALVSIAVPVGESWKGVVVPRGAVLDDEGSSVVYVQTEGEAFEERSVRLGPVSGAYIGIQSGVSAGERVVTLGANVVRLSSRAGSAPAHGHVH